MKTKYIYCEWMFTKICIKAWVVGSELVLYTRQTIFSVIVHHISNKRYVVRVSVWRVDIGQCGTALSVLNWTNVHSHLPGRRGVLFMTSLWRGRGVSTPYSQLLTTDRPVTEETRRANKHTVSSNDLLRVRFSKQEFTRC